MHMHMHNMHMCMCMCMCMRAWSVLGHLDLVYDLTVLDTLCRARARAFQLRDCDSIGGAAHLKRE